MTQTEILQELKNKIAVEGTHNEGECAALLKEVSYVLLPTEQGHIIYTDTEQIAHAGRIDVLVYADCRQTSGSYRRVLYLWELKAPQLPLFLIDTASRAQPSKDLYDAENQLLHYHDSLRNNDSFRSTNGIGASDDIKFGGIVIGRSSSYVKNTAGINDEKAMNLAEQTLRIRQRLFYDPHGIKIWTWDTVASSLSLMNRSFKEYRGDAVMRIDARLDVSLPLFTLEGACK